MNTKKYDVSIHFTIKGQTMKEIDKAIDTWLAANSTTVDFSERQEDEPETILHHCFLPRHIIEQKAFATDLIDSLDEIGGENQVCWHFASTTIGMSRLLMLLNLKRLNGIALFVGAIKEGVLEEYRLAKEIGVQVVEIPL